MNHRMLPLFLFGLLTLGLPLTSVAQDATYGVPVAVPSVPPTSATLDSSRWELVFTDVDRLTYIDKKSLRRCNFSTTFFTWFNLNNPCATVQNGYVFWKLVVPKETQFPERTISGLLDCKNREIDFFPIRPQSDNEAIYRRLCPRQAAAKR